MQAMDSGTLLMLLTVVLLLLLLSLVVWMLVLIGRQKKGNIHWISELIEAMNSGMHVMEDELQQHSLAQRAELLQTLHAVDGSLQSTLSGAMQQQSIQLQGMQKQTFESGQAQEMRQHRMFCMTEESLQRFEQRVKSVESMVDKKLQQNDQRLEMMRQTLEGGMNRLSSENNFKLEEMRKTVDEKLHETLDKRLNDSFTQVSKRLEQVYQSLGEMHTLAVGVGDLKKMLGNVKTRGIWGEMQLGALLEQALTEKQFARNVVVKPGSSERVEFAVCLPGHHGEEDSVYLPIDSKFPQEDYTRLVEASHLGDVRVVEGARKALMNAVRTEAKRIHDKYIDPPHTTDFAVMFLPLESLYAEVMRHADVVEQLQREYRVVMAGPNTLLALLNSLQMGFRTLAIERRSAEVWKLLGAVKTDFGNFTHILQRTQEKLQQASDSIDSAFVRTRSIERKLRRVEALDKAEAGRMLEDGEKVDSEN